MRPARGAPWLATLAFPHFCWRSAASLGNIATVVAAGQREPARVGSRSPGSADEEWVLLAYRLPRVPSTPRSTVWRKLKRLGVVQVTDGVAALPADARTREALEWIAEEVVDHDGEATVWLGRPADSAGRAAMVARMTAVVGRQYDQVIAEAQALAGGDASATGRALTRLRREFHRIEARDFFPSTRREDARHALDAVGELGVGRASR